MVRTGLDRLQKEIDALSYNSRTILNALIRSVTASGSNKGFSAIRGGEKVLLTRIDIYRLYTFYQEWENNEFAPENTTASTGQKALVGFDELIAKHDKTPVKNDAGEITDSTATTTAIIQHSKIMFQNIDNKEESDSFWTDLIKNNNNPKGVSNASPIPIHLRTPIFDENLSTAKYNQHPTYLFPMGYFTRDTLGFVGDGVDHRLEGDSWTIQGDNYVRLESDFISLGKIETSATLKTKDARTGAGSTSMGSSHAQGTFSIAAGLESMVPDNSLVTEDQDQIQTVGGIALGVRNIASHDYSSVIGGNDNSSSGQGSSVLGGTGNKATGQYGVILGGLNNVVGGKVFDFVFPADPGFSSSSSPGEEETGDNNIILVKDDVTSEYKAGDIVTLFDFTVRNDNSSIPFHQPLGDGEKAFQATIQDAVYHAEGVFAGANATFTQINLDLNIPRKGILDGGSISVTSRAIQGFQTKLGYASAAIGEGIIATGKNQVVVGRFNEVNFSTDEDVFSSGDDRVPRFIVGTGTNGIDGRKNTLEVHKNELFIYGSDPTDSNPKFFSSPIGAREISTTSFQGFRFGKQGLESYMGKNHFYAYSNHSGDSGFEFVGQVEQSNEFRIEAHVGRGINLFSGFKAITLRAGVDVGFTTLSDTRNIKIQAEHNIIIEGFNGVSIKASDTTNLSLEFGSLTLTGDTFGALSTAENQFSHFTGSDSSNDLNWSDGTGEDKLGSMSVFRSGFFAFGADTDPFLSFDSNGNTRSKEPVIQQEILGFPLGGDSTDLFSSRYHMINTSMLDNVSGRFYNWQMMYGVDPDQPSARIGVRRAISGGDWFAANALDGQNINYIPFKEDIQFRIYKSDTEFNLRDDGTTTTIRESQFIVNTAAVPSEGVDELRPKADYSEPTPLNNALNIDFTYTKVGETVFFEMTLRIESGLDSITTSEVHAFMIEIDADDSVKKTLRPILNDKDAPSCFSNTTYFRDVSTIGDGQAIKYKNAMYSLQVIEHNQVAGGTLDRPMFVFTKTADYSAYVNESSISHNNIFSNHDAQKPITFSGFYFTRDT